MGIGEDRGVFSHVLGIGKQARTRVSPGVDTEGTGEGREGTRGKEEGLNSSQPGPRGS